MESRHHNLKTRQRRERHGYPDNLSLRVHRALSWLDRAERDDDPDSRFIFLWIAFNAAYATEIDDRVHLNEQATFNAFLEKLCELDGEKRLDELVWEAYPNAIRVLLDNPYVFSCFWDHQKGVLTEAQWKRSFDGANLAPILIVIPNAMARSVVLKSPWRERGFRFGWWSMVLILPGCLLFGDGIVGRWRSMIRLGCDNESMDAGGDSSCREESGRCRTGSDQRM